MAANQHQLKMIFVTLLVLLAAAPHALAAAPKAAEPESVEVFRSGSNGYHTYRIPAIVLTRRGTLLAFAEGRKGSRSDAGDIDLVVKRSYDNGRTWSDASVVLDAGPDTVGNPAPVIDRKTGNIFLLFTRNFGDDAEVKILNRTSRGTRTVWVMSSKDDGRTWTAPDEITSTTKPQEWTWYATGPGAGIQLRRGGRMVVACDHNRGDASQRYSHVLYSDDQGRTWKLGGSAGPKCNESVVVELRDGTLLLNMRSYAGLNRRAVATSRDRGLTWTEPRPDDALVEPVCHASMIRAGRLLLFSNPAATTRVNMTVKASRDEGRTWPVARVMHAGPAAYSALTMLNDGSAGLLFENGEKDPYERITFTRFSLKWLEGK